MQDHQEAGAPVSSFQACIQLSRKNIQTQMPLMESFVFRFVFVLFLPVAVILDPCQCPALCRGQQGDSGSGVGLGTWGLMCRISRKTFGAPLQGWGLDQTMQINKSTGSCMP